MAKICVDAGHYGDYNQSPADKNYYEARTMWQLQRLLCTELNRRGIATVTTRTDQQTDLSLTERGRMAQGCDLFLSLHSNAVGDTVREDIDYPVAYVSLSGAADEIGLLLAQNVQKLMGTRQSARIEKRRGSTGADYYGVLRGAAEAGVPGLILEHSFHTNTAMTRWLMDGSNLARLASAHADVLAGYFAEKEGQQMERYKYLADIPNEDGFRDIIAGLMDRGVIRGDGSDSAGNGDVIDLSHDMVRLLVILHRAGVL